MSGLVTFPEGFRWGAATSAYQIEGAVATDGRGPSIWDVFSHTAGRTHDGDTGDVAADHYHRFADDVGLMADLGLQEYRFSVSWPRVLPDGVGQVNTTGLDFYKRLVDTLLDAGISPHLTLYHWDLPYALEQKGGWRNRDVIEWFAAYAEVVFAGLHDVVPNWTTHNEPWVVAYLGHYAGQFAPGIADLDAALATHHHLLVSHGHALQAMRAIDEDPNFGIVLNPEIPQAVTDDEATVDAARRHEALVLRSCTEPLLAARYPDDLITDLSPSEFPVRDGDLATISQPIDFLGVNFYRETLLERSPGDDSMSGALPGVTGVRSTNQDRPVTDMGWPWTPEGLTRLLVWLDDTYEGLPPIWITENGAAYDDPVAEDGTIDDVRRIAYLHQHLLAVRRAIDAGVDVAGYFAWSLLDNFEWAEGYAKRFGLVHVDYETLERTPRRSARWYADVVAANGVAPELDLG